MKKLLKNKSGKGFFKKLFIIIFILLVALAVLIFFNVYGLKDKVVGYIKGLPFFSFLEKKEEVVKPQLSIIVPPLEVQSWCKIQSFYVPPEDISMISRKIIGYDSLASCCVEESIGVDSCLKRETTMQLCINSNVGMAQTVDYFKVDGFFVNEPANYQNFLNNLHKSSNYGCVPTGYPEELKNEIQLAMGVTY